MATTTRPNDWDGHSNSSASREFSRSVELTGAFGGVLRGDPDEFRLSDGLTWGLGATFPSRSQFRALVEWTGEFVIKDNVLVTGAPLVAEDGSVAPTCQPHFDPTAFKFGGVWQARNGFFVHAGGNYSPGTQGRVVAGNDIDHSAWGLDLRIGFHPGVTPPPACAPHQGNDHDHQHRDRDAARSTGTRTEPPADGTDSVRPERAGAWPDGEMRRPGNGSGRRTADLSLDRNGGQRQSE